MASFDRVMRSLSSAVQEADEEIRKAFKSSTDWEYVDIVVNEESDFVENLLGAALVTCQAEITSVSGHVRFLHTEAQSAQKPLITTDGKKSSILTFGSPQVRSTGFSEIQVINAFANYFKHKDEWANDWTNAVVQQKQTVDILLAAGATEYSTGTLRQCCDALKVELDQLQLLSEMVRNWSKAIHSAYEKELSSLNLL